MQITGTIKKVGSTEVVSEKFTKREFILTDNSSQYPQHISFQLSQDKVNLIDDYSEGDDITVHFNLRGRMWISPKEEEKYFNTLDVWKIEGVFDDAKETTPKAENNYSKKSAEEDLPF